MCRAGDRMRERREKRAAGQTAAGGASESAQPRGARAKAGAGAAADADKVCTYCRAVCDSTWGRPGRHPLQPATLVLRQPSMARRRACTALQGMLADLPVPEFPPRGDPLEVHDASQDSDPASVEGPSTPSTPSPAPSRPLPQVWLPRNSPLGPRLVTACGLQLVLVPCLQLPVSSKYLADHVRLLVCGVRSRLVCLSRVGRHRAAA